MRRARSLKRFQQVLFGALLLAAISELSREGVAQDKAAKKAQGFIKVAAVESDTPLAVAYSPRGSAVTRGLEAKSRSDPRTGDFRLIPSRQKYEFRPGFRPTAARWLWQDDHARLFDIRWERWTDTRWP